MIFFFKQKTAYEITVWLEFRRCSSDLSGLQAIYFLMSLLIFDIYIKK